MVDLTTLNDNQLTLLRRQSLGFIFQSFNLLPMFTARQNILIPLILDGAKPDTTWLGVLAKTLGLEERLTHWSSELSGGQQQCGHRQGPHHQTFHCLCGRARWKPGYGLLDRGAQLPAGFGPRAGTDHHHGYA